MVNPRLTDIEVTKQELKFRKKAFPDVSKVVNKNPLCTSCNKSVKLNVINGKPHLHPQLETLLCEKCHNFYGDGEFSLDEDGSDKYCRWCGQGGTIYQCSKCVAGFCKKCIKRNLIRSILDEVDRDDWLCFICNVQPLWELRAMAWAAVSHAENIKPPPSMAKAKRSSSTDKSKVASLTKKHSKLVSQNLQSVIGDFLNLGKELKKECDKVMEEKCRQRHIVDQKSEVDAIGALSIILKNSQDQLQEIQDKLGRFSDLWKASREMIEIKIALLEKDSLTQVSDSVSSSSDPGQSQSEEIPRSSLPEEEKGDGDSTRVGQSGMETVEHREEPDEEKIHCSQSESHKEEVSNDPKNSTTSQNEESCCESKSKSDTEKEESLSDPKSNSDSQTETMTDSKNNEDSKKEENSSVLKNITENQKEESSSVSENTQENIASDEVSLDSNEEKNRKRSIENEETTDCDESIETPKKIRLLPKVLNKEEKNKENGDICQQEEALSVNVKNGSKEEMMETV